ncbi:MAG: hypothetical protein ABIT83_21915 [Massilia sp.]
MTIQHTFLAIDEGRQQLSLIDTGATGAAAFRWTIDLADYPLARDMQRLDETRVLVGYDRGFFELEIGTGRVLSNCARWTEVTAVCRQDDGSTLVTGFNLDGSGGINVLTLDRELGLIHTARRDGDYVRLMRRTAAGTYLLCMNDHILETTPELADVRRFATPGFEHAWKAERRADGSTLVSAGYGAFMAEFDAEGECVRRFGAADEVAPAIAPFFYASFEQLANGRLLVANWQGHGPDNGAKGCQLLEFDEAGQVVGSWSAGERISSLQGILLV